MVQLLTMLVGGWVSSHLLYIHSRVRIPGWIDDETKHSGWKRWNFAALIVSSVVVVVVACLLLLEAFTVWFNLAFIVMTSVIMYMFVQSLHTDVKYRLVDRWSLYFASLISFIPNLLLAVNGNVDVPVWAIFMLVALALTFFPIMGASDGRALFLAAVATVPLFPTGYYFLGVILFLFFAFVHVVVSAVKDKHRNGVIAVIRSVFGDKRSIPAVPFILAPFILLIADVFTGWVQSLPEDLFWFL